jgi:hypothetical protein
VLLVSIHPSNHLGSEKFPCHIVALTMPNGSHPRQGKKVSSDSACSRAVSLGIRLAGAGQASLLLTGPPYRFSSIGNSRPLWATSECIWNTTIDEQGGGRVE